MYCWACSDQSKNKKQSINPRIAYHWLRWGLNRINSRSWSPPVHSTQRASLARKDSTEPSSLYSTVNSGRSARAQAHASRWIRNAGRVRARAWGGDSSSRAGQRPSQAQAPLGRLGDAAVSSEIRWVECKLARHADLSFRAKLCSRTARSQLEFRLWTGSKIFHFSLTFISNLSLIQFWKTCFAYLQKIKRQNRFLVGAWTSSSSRRHRIAGALRARRWCSLSRSLFLPKWRSLSWGTPVGTWDLARELAERGCSTNRRWN